MAASGALHQEMGEAAADVPTQRALLRKCAATLAKTKLVHKMKSRDALRSELNVLQKLQYLTLWASVDDDVSCDQRK